MDEQQYITEFVKNNPYPSYETVSNAIMNFLKSDNDANAKASYFQFQSEYGEYQHELMKVIYENFSDKSFCKNIGEEIHNNGGFTAMQGCYYIFRNFSPFATADNGNYHSYGRLLEYYWDGVGNWSC